MRIASIFLFLSMSIYSLQSQIINIPDPNFKSRLIDLGLDLNQDGEIQKIEAEEVTFLDLGSANIADLTGLEAFSEVVYLYVSQNPITSMDISPLTKIEHINSTYTDITSLNLTGLNELEYIICSFSTEFTSLTIKNCPNVKNITVDNCNLSTLDISDSGITELTEFKCNYNQITNIDIRGIHKIDNYEFSNNQLTEIDFTDLVINYHGSLSNNKLTSLDFHRTYCSVSIHNNEIEYLILKESNGFPDITGVPTLKYICARESEVAGLQNIANFLGYTCHVNSYCSIGPGGATFTVKGSHKYDENADGCDAQDVILSNFKINISNGTISGSTISDASGAYEIQVGAGAHTFSPYMENAQYFSINPASFLASFPANPDPTIRNICIKPNGAHNDVEVMLMPVTGTASGFDAVFKLIYKNVGTTILSSNIQLNFEEEFMNYVSASLNPYLQSAGVINWNYTDLHPFEKREILIKFKLNSPMDNPPLNDGDVLNFTAQIFPMESDENSTNNTFVLLENVVNSFDPNDKRCLEGKFLKPNIVGNYIHYVIRFENTGSADAVNIVVKDVIDTSRLDISSLLAVDGSHNYTTKISGNKVEFFFTDINLPFDDANNDGYIAFKIKTKPDLQIHDEIKNKAEIYFDFNFPIITNEEVSVISTLSTDKNKNINSAISIVPTLVSDHFTIIGVKQISGVEILSSTGKLISRQKTGSRVVDTSSLLPGIYFVRVSGEGGYVVRRVVKVN